MNELGLTTSQVEVFNEKTDLFVAFYSGKVRYNQKTGQFDKVNCIANKNNKETK